MVIELKEKHSEMIELMKISNTYQILIGNFKDEDEEFVRCFFKVNRHKFLLYNKQCNTCAKKNNERHI